MKHYFTLIILLVVTNIGFSQRGETSHHFIKIAPLNLIPTLNNSSIQLSLEQRISLKYSMHYELGYIYDNETFSYYSYSSSKGYRGRIAFRKYHNVFATKKMNFFYAPNFSFQQVFREELQRFCLTPDCSSLIEAPFVSMNNETTLSLGFGWHRVSPAGFSMEIEILSGLSHETSKSIGVPFYIPTIPNNSYYNYNQIYPVFNFIFRMGWAVGKN